YQLVIKNIYQKWCHRYFLNLITHVVYCKDINFIGSGSLNLWIFANFHELKNPADFYELHEFFNPRITDYG
ncbi:MAG: hypothetical protein LBR10_11365, partial [Prevotellaceae bacterium]|nr:hypothetical protein [Prevotellaceae bacterium]